MSVFDEETRQVLIELFNSLPKKLVDYLIVASEQCDTCKEAIELANEIMNLSKGKITFNIIDKNTDEAKKLSARYVPAFIFDLPERNVRYYGLPAGQEFPPFIYMHEYIAKGTLRIPQNIIEKVKEVKTRLHIKIFVTPECPMCPLVVDTFNQFGIINKNLLIEVIEAVELPWEADKYNVMYVPTVIISDVERYDGYAPPDVFVEMLKRAEEKISNQKE
ncbi:thioredoxin family protein [Desulfurococcaceae archaeon MEX13E-LK6-19]|nr:thioredoxin family protein [Desulfurococcaceae archaeon MEX13E-LK6-19]